MVLHTEFQQKGNIKDEPSYSLAQVILVKLQLALNKVHPEHIKTGSSYLQSTKSSGSTKSTKSTKSSYKTGHPIKKCKIIKNTISQRPRYIELAAVESLMELSQSSLS